MFLTTLVDQIIASDGVWGVLSNAEVAGLVSSFSFEDTKEASDIILQK
jgi:serine/threonine protein phosphatase PrpC